MEEFDKAEDHFMRASDLYEEMKEQKSVQEVQDKLMFIFSQPKYLENRKQAIREGLKKPETEKDLKLKLMLLNDFGNVLFMSNNWDEAAEVARETIALHEQSGDKQALGGAYGNLGSILLQQEDFKGAEENYSNAIKI